MVTAMVLMSVGGVAVTWEMNVAINRSASSVTGLCQAVEVESGSGWA